jgi:hypothetical protein
MHASQIVSILVKEFRGLRLLPLMVCRLQITALSEYAISLSDERSSVFRNIYIYI